MGYIKESSCSWGRDTRLSTWYMTLITNSQKFRKTKYFGVCVRGEEEERKGERENMASVNRG